MKNIKNLLRTKLLFFVVVLIFSSLNLFAQSQGPTAPEAASFEPIDATDMVNISTGDLTYVLPLLNIPSPEGGYPVALAYHAGIAMDQESTWTGLGWNLNAGAINRSINGYPDDYKGSLINEYFYDEGGQESIYSLSLGYSAGAVSAGLGLSWGSNRSLGGHVSIGYGTMITGVKGLASVSGNVRLGSDGSIGISVGATLKGGMTLGVNASSKGGVDGSVGFDNNAVGFSISTNGSANIDLVGGIGNDNQLAVGLTLSSTGFSMDSKITNTKGNKVTGGLGIGIQVQFESTLKMGDYTSNTSGWMIPLVVPTKTGVFSLSFGKQIFRYYLGKKEYSYIYGATYFSKSPNNTVTYQVRCLSNENNRPIQCGSLITEDHKEALDAKASYENADYDCNCTIQRKTNTTAFMDIYEVPLNGDTSLSADSKIIYNNPVFPSYDKYNVQAQGLSGGMSSRLFDNGALFGLTGKENNEDYKLKYTIDGNTIDSPVHAQFTQKPYFYFDNEISTYLGVADVNKASFKSTNQSEILSYYLDGVEDSSKPRRKNATYIEYFSNDEILNNYSTVKSKGYLLPSENGFDRSVKPKDGIGAFKITSVDGKTYHYSLPVYNHEIVTRTFGIIEDRPGENQSYFEKGQFEPYATHWLLTAVTGSDYYDANNNGKADKEDYGYWVEFDYGKWSDTFIWKSPYGKDYLDNDENPEIKTSVRGRKEIYYLDRVKTRTHTALFLKSERQDGLSQDWDYKSVDHISGIDQNSSAFQTRFTVPSHAPLKLDKIILVKNENDIVTKASGTSNEEYVDIIYNGDKSMERAYYKLKDNVLDIGDNWQGLLSNASKIIDLTYENPASSLVKGSPNTTNSSYGRLTLKSVDFKGKYGTDIMPPYVFSYNTSSYNFDIEDKDGFGYKKNDNDLWSLNKITTPQGGEILVNYEPHQFKNVTPHKFSLTNSDKNYASYVEDWTYEMESLYNLQIGSNVELSLRTRRRVGPNNDCNEVRGYYDGPGVITNIDGNIVTVEPTGNITTIETGTLSGGCTSAFSLKTTFNIPSNSVYNPMGGIRVASLLTTNGVDIYTTEYKYGENEDGVGVISYLPFAPELQEELPYSSELPGPKVMYEYVTMQTKNTDNQSDGKIEYKFKVFKEKDVDAIKFGDLYEIEVTGEEKINPDANKDVNISSYTIKDNLATLGSLLEVSTYNSEGHQLSKIENEYYAPEETPNKLGITKESYQSYKTVDYTHTSKRDKWLINSSTRIKYPNLLKQSTNYNMNNQYSTQFNDLDIITGKPREIYSYSSEGIKLKTKTVFAFDEYLGMGSKVDNIDNSNMLSQETASYTYLIDPVSGDEKIIGASISTWNNDWVYRDQTGNESSPSNNKEKIWRKHINYVWKGDLDSDGAYVGYNQSNDDGFDWGIGASQSDDSSWQKASEVKRYNHYSSPLEVEDINENLASSKKGDHQSKVIATSNSAYTEMYYSGAEYLSETDNSYFDGEIKSNYREFGTYHTGNYSIKVSNNQQGFYTTLKSNEHRETRYKISVWARKDNYANAKVFDGNSLKEFNGEKTLAGDWILLNHYVDLSSSSKNIYVTSNSGNIFYDDFRIHPVSSSMISYVYNKFDEVTYITGANGLSTYYIYDDAGRLEETWVEVIDNQSAGITGGFKKINENKYNYKNN